MKHLRRDERGGAPALEWLAAVALLAVLALPLGKLGNHVGMRLAGQDAGANRAEEVEHTTNLPFDCEGGFVKGALRAFENGKGEVVGDMFGITDAELLVWLQPGSATRIIVGAAGTAPAIIAAGPAVLRHATSGAVASLRDDPTGAARAALDAMFVDPVATARRMSMDAWRGSRSLIAAAQSRDCVTFGRTLRSGVSNAPEFALAAADATALLKVGARVAARRARTEALARSAGAATKSIQRRGWWSAAADRFLRRIGVGGAGVKSTSVPAPQILATIHRQAPYLRLAPFRFVPGRQFRPEIRMPPSFASIVAKDHWERQARSFVDAVNRAEEAAYAHGWRPSVRGHTYDFHAFDEMDAGLRSDTAKVRAASPVFRAREGWTYIDGHGEDTVLLYEGRKWTPRRTAWELERTGYAGGPILTTCCAHGNGFAQELANHIGQPVVAMDDDVVPALGFVSDKARAAWHVAIPDMWKTHPERHAPPPSAQTKASPGRRALVAKNIDTAEPMPRGDVERWADQLADTLGEAELRLLAQRRMRIELWRSSPVWNKPLAVETSNNRLRLDVASLSRMRREDVAGLIRDAIAPYLVHR